MRNKEINGKEEVETQQKRIAKATISVCMLHKLQVQSRLQDAFLFYHNLEEEIQKATEAQLEGFIALKINAITNSITKWTERSIFKVKSVIEWICTGEKRNMGVIEQLDQRRRY